MSIGNTGRATDDGRPRRVIVLGVTGSGKTTAGKRIAAALNAKHIELDALWWGPEWTPSEPDDFRARLTATIDGVDTWVTDGGYASHVWDITWVKADAALWLDYPLPLIMSRLFRRTTGRLIRREELWNGNTENFRSQFLSRDSLFSWAVQTHRKYRKSYPEHFARPELRNLWVARCTSPAQAEKWIRRLEVEV
jgi:adenylate kinase family enzyme